MTGLFLDHPLFFSGALFVLLVIAVESGFRIAVLSAANLDEDRREQIAASRDSLGIPERFAREMFGLRPATAVGLPGCDILK